MIDEQGNPNGDLIVAMTAQNRIDMGLQVTDEERKLAEDLMVMTSDTTVSDNPKTIKEIEAILSHVAFSAYSFQVHFDNSKLYLQTVFDEPDVITSELKEQKTRKWR